MEETYKKLQLTVIGNQGFFLKGILSQWYDSPFFEWNEDGTFTSYNCAEKYMMHKKALLFGDTEIAHKILNTDSPPEIKKLGRMVRGFYPELWDLHKVNIVYTGNLLKFSQHPEYGKLLIKTPYLLVEANPKDNIWAIGKSVDDPNLTDQNSWGLNLLGKVLMKVREAISRETVKPFLNLTKQ